MQTLAKDQIWSPKIRNVDDLIYEHMLNNSLTQNIKQIINLIISKYNMSSFAQNSENGQYLINVLTRVNKKLQAASILIDQSDSQEIVHEISPDFVNSCKDKIVEDFKSATENENDLWKVAYTHYCSELKITPDCESDEEYGILYYPMDLKSISFEYKVASLPSKLIDFSMRMTKIPCANCMECSINTYMCLLCLQNI